MRFAIILLSILLSLSNLAMARTVTDHDGHVVDVPDMPRRIVSLHDWTLTTMTYELGASLVASTGRMAGDGSFFIRGGHELFGLDFSKIELVFPHGGTDLERIRMLKPDLILANAGDYSAMYDQLASIAPTLIFNPESGRPAFDLYRDLADWLGKRARFDELERKYLSRLQTVKAQLQMNGKRQTYAAILTNGRDGTLTLLKEYGPLTTALDDLGFVRMPITSKLRPSENRMTVGAELIGELDADYIFTSYLPDRGETSQTVFDDLARIAPGYEEFLKAYKARRIISMSRYDVYPTSFEGLTLMLDEISAAVQSDK